MLDYLYVGLALLTGVATVFIFTDKEFLDDFFGSDSGIGTWIVGVLAIFSIGFFGAIAAPLVWVALLGKGLYELGNRHAKK